MSARTDETYSIRQMCERYGCTPRALRFYEDKGLLAPTRQGLTRIYHRRDCVRLSLVLKAKRVGLSLNEIAELLDLYDRPDGGVLQLTRSLKTANERIVALEKQRIEIDSAIADLKVARVAIEERLRNLRPDLLPDAAECGEVRSELAREPA